MLNLSNVLSFSRAGLALAFLSESPLVRAVAIALAMLTDALDGFIARKKGITSQFGAILDPIMDKFFVLFASGILFREHKLVVWQFIAFLSRDIALCLFGLYLLAVKGWKEYECKSIFWGKTATALQFLILAVLTLNYTIVSWVYLIFTMIGIGAFMELVRGYKAMKKKASM